MKHLGDILNLSVKRHPSKIAIIEPGANSTTYSELNLEVQKYAAFLKSKDISRHDRIGILCSKSISSVVAILACIEIGAVYIPVDFEAPQRRNTQIFNDCQVKGIFVDNSLSSYFQDNCESQSTLESIHGSQLYFISCSYSTKIEINAIDDLSYILYTSGSTGVPKGVMITHQNALAFIEWASSQFQITSKDIITSIAPFHFDLSIFDLFVSFKEGATLILMNHKIAKNPRMIATLIESEKISVIYSTPTLFKLMLRYGKLERFNHSSLRTILYAGEAFSIEPLKNLMQTWDKTSFFNLYGPTESNVITWHQVDNPINEKIVKNIPIGKSCPYVTCKLWEDGWLEEYSGQKGELLVSGDSVAKGYFNLKEKTSDVFVDIDGERWYKTGDIVEVNYNGDYIFKGRADRMIKRKGYRIELGEIESILRLHKQIKEVAVVSETLNNTDTIIKAFIILQADQEKLPIIDLKFYCNNNLINYMTPDEFIYVLEFPQTSSHKVDYQRLRKLSNV